MNKTETLRKILGRTMIDMLLITDPYSLRYYTGFKGGEGVAIVTRKSALLITDSRYTEAAGKDTLLSVKGTDEAPFNVIEYNNRNPILTIISEIVDADEVKSIGIEDRSMVYADFHRYRNALKTVSTWVAMDKALLVPRQVKTEEEIGYLEKAEAIGDAAFEDILGIIKPGMTELDVVAELEYRMKKHGAEGFSFDTIVASGMHSSMPHAIPTNKQLTSGEFVTMDFGCTYNGYCSDMTRTICIGKASDQMKLVYQTVLDAHLMVLDQMKPGMVCKDVDKIARDYITSKGYGEYFGHGLGHSVGLFIHETPALNTRDDTVLRPNMIETDEPGIYLPEKFGVRIEDMVLVTEDGCRSLAKSPKELIEL